MFLHPSAAAKHYKVSEQTLRTWSTEGKIKYTTTRGGHRRYIIENQPVINKDKYIYARVSSRKQENDLDRQIRFLQSRYPNHKIEKDIGSGINYNRQGFKRILECLFSGNLEEVVVASKDRFSRIGTEIFEWIFQKFGARLVVVSGSTYTKSRAEDLADDLMEVITSFTARYYGARKYSDAKTKILSKYRAKKHARKMLRGAPLPVQ